MNNIREYAPLDRGTSLGHSDPRRNGQMISDRLKTPRVAKYAKAHPVSSFMRPSVG